MQAVRRIGTGNPLVVAFGSGKQRDRFTAGCRCVPCGRPESPWNFWFVYEMINKPTYEQNGETLEDREDKLFRIYFDDIRPLRASGNQADEVGLFLKIKYFGPAVAVEL